MCAPSLNYGAAPASVSFRFFRNAKATPTDIRRGAIFFTPSGMVKDVAGSVLNGQYGLHAVWTERQMVSIDVTLGKGQSAKTVKALIPKVENEKVVYKPIGVHPVVQQAANEAIAAFWEQDNVLGCTIGIDDSGEQAEFEVKETVLRNQSNNGTKLKGAQQALDKAKAALPADAPVAESQTDEEAAAGSDEQPY